MAAAAHALTNPAKPPSSTAAAHTNGSDGSAGPQQPGRDQVGAQVDSGDHHSGPAECEQRREVGVGADPQCEHRARRTARRHRQRRPQADREAAPGATGGDRTGRNATQSRRQQSQDARVEGGRRARCCSDHAWPSGRRQPQKAAPGPGSYPAISKPTAAPIALVGASRPVHILNCSAAWNKSIPVPLRVCAPASSAISRIGVTAGV